MSNPDWASEAMDRIVRERLAREKYERPLLCAVVPPVDDDSALDRLPVILVAVVMALIVVGASLLIRGI